MTHRIQHEPNHGEPATRHGRQRTTLADQITVLRRQAVCPCGASLEKSIEFDHRRPLALGGDNHPSNLDALCAPCHRKKTRQDKAEIAKAKRLERSHFKHPNPKCDVCSGSGLYPVYDQAGRLVKDIACPECQ